MEISTLNIDAITLDELSSACQRETRKYIQGKQSDARYCLEIFRRALSRNEANHERSHPPRYADEEARTALITLYSEYIRAQVNRSATALFPDDEIVQQVWLNFWQRANDGLSFSSLNGALAYLSQVTVSVVIKQSRGMRKRRREQSLEAMVAESGESAEHVGTEDLFSTYAHSRLRARIRELLTDQTERQIFGLRQHGFAPREISQLLKGQIGAHYTPRQISDILERCFRRLSEDPEIIALLQSD